MAGAASMGETEQDRGLYQRGSLRMVREGTEDRGHRVCKGGSETKKEKEEDHKESEGPRSSWGSPLPGRMGSGAQGPVWLSDQG